MVAERVDHPIYFYRHAVQMTIDGGGLPIHTGYWGDLVIPFGCTPESWDLLLDQTGSIVIDLWADLFASAPPTIADSITGSNKPTVSGATKATGTCAGWVTPLLADSVLRVNVDSATTAQRALLSFTVRRIE